MSGPPLSPSNQYPQTQSAAALSNFYLRHSNRILSLVKIFRAVFIDILFLYTLLHTLYLVWRSNRLKLSDLPIAQSMVVHAHQCTCTHTVAADMSRVLNVNFYRKLCEACVTFHTWYIYCCLPTKRKTYGKKREAEGAELFENNRSVHEVRNVRREIWKVSTHYIHVYVLYIHKKHTTKQTFRISSD